MTLSSEMVRGDLLPTPGPMLRVVTKKKLQLEARYNKDLLAPARRAGDTNWSTAERIERQTRRRQLLLSANFLELCLVSAGLAEVNRSIGPLSPEEHHAQGERLLDMCARLIGLDPRPVLHRYQGPLRVAQHEPAGALLPSAERVLEQMVRVSGSVRATCPIRTLEQWGHELNAADLSHRCRKAYDGLTAFIRRHSTEFDEQMSTIGRAYSEGRLTMEDVSRILQVPKHEAVVLLERYSFYRPLDTLLLEDSRRRELLKAIAEEVRSKSGEWVVPPESLLDRDVIASQRIEGVDARPWLVQKKD